MTTKLKIGFIALCDCAALIVAKERGFFVEHGLNVELSKEPSWANIRDKVAFGVLDAAHMLAPMLLETSFGIGNVNVPLKTAFTLNHGGVGITLNKLAALSSHGTIGMVYPFSLHQYCLRSWMQREEIVADLVVVSPKDMMNALTAGHIQGYCVGAPWNNLAEKMGVGIRIGTPDMQDRMDKVLGVSSDWAHSHPETHLALLRAVAEASQWTQSPDNRREVAEILSRPAYLNVPADVVYSGLQEVTFSGANVNEPSLDDARWYWSQMQRWGQCGTLPLDEGRLRDIFDVGLYRMIKE